MLLCPYKIPNAKTYKNGKTKLIGIKKIKWFDTPHRTIFVHKEGAYQNIKYEEFNPGSRSHIRKWMEDDYNYKFPYYTEKGGVKVDPDSLENMVHPAGKLLKKYLKIAKDQSQVGGADGSWLTLLNRETGALHGRVDTLGATTHRATHSKPNLAQIPADGIFRELFIAHPGDVLIGADLKNIEIRVLAHYLAYYDNGKYAKAVLSKDMHWYHAKLAGFWTKDDCEWNEHTATKEMKTARSASKNFFFGYLYGQGDTIRGYNLWKPNCLTSYTKKEYNAAKRRVERRLTTIEDVKYFPLKKDMYVIYDEELILKTIYGKQVADTFLTNLTGIQDLIKDCQKQSKEKGSVTAIDGRELRSRSPHSALNLLLQGNAGIIAKQWMVNYQTVAINRNIISGKHYRQMAYIHDEFQISCKPFKAEALGECLVDGCLMIQKQFNMNILIEADYIIGESWAQTH